MSLFKVGSRGKGLGNVAMHREEVRRGREGNTHFKLVRLQLETGPALKGNSVAKTSLLAVGPVGSRGPHFFKGRAWVS